jgi:hypothetical protein
MNGIEADVHYCSKESMCSFGFTHYLGSSFLICLYFSLALLLPDIYYTVAEKRSILCDVMPQR